MALSALARNICCTLSWTMFLLRLRPVLVHYRRCCTIPRRWYYLQSCSLHFNKYGRLHISKYGLLYVSKDGLKAQKELSPEQRSGYSWLSILRSERAKERRKCADSKQFVDVWVWILLSFCAYSAPVSLCIFTQSVALGYIPVGASPRLRSNVISQIICRFAPPCSKHLLHNILYDVPVTASHRLAQM